MAKLSPLMIAPPLIFAALAAMFAFGMARKDPDQLPSALAGKAAPAVVVSQVSDLPPFGDSDLRNGEVTLVNFWASWCAPCRAEHPSLTKIAESGVKIYGVNYKDQDAKAVKFLNELGNPFAGVGADETGRMALNWGLYGVPETYVIDGEGNIVFRHAGPITDRVIEATIMPAIEAARLK